MRWASSRNATRSGRSRSDTEILLERAQQLLPATGDFLVAKGALRMTERQPPREAPHTRRKPGAAELVEKDEALEQLTSVLSDDSLDARGGHVIRNEQREVELGRRGHGERAERLDGHRAARCRALAPSVR